MLFKKKKYLSYLEYFKTIVFRLICVTFLTSKALRSVFSFNLCRLKLE